jgi:hypothetical protein
MKIHVPCGQTERLADEQAEDQMDGQREGRSDMKKSIAVFSNFSKAIAMLQTC